MPPGPAGLTIKDPTRQPPVMLLLATAANIAHALQVTLRVTETIGSPHGAWSLHYSLRAIDLGTKEHPPDTVAAIMGEFTTRLPQAQVIWEARGTPNEHLHVEWDPRGAGVPAPRQGAAAGGIDV